MGELMQDMREFYGRLQDDESRRIFLFRWMHSMTGDKKWARELGKQTPEGDRFYALPAGKKDYIFGCGLFGEKVYDLFETEWKGFVDNNSHLWGVRSMVCQYCLPSRFPRMRASSWE